jgi:NADH-quinone oxidoreductase subunit G
VQRLKPRQNMEVNGWWMCDYGRLSYEWLNEGDRLEAPLVRGAGGDTRAVAWKDALAAVLERARAMSGKKVKAVASARSSNEDLGSLSALVKALGGGEIVHRSARAADEIVLKGFPTLARRRDLAGNVKGADLLGMKRVGSDEGTGGLGGVADHDGIVIVLGDALEDADESFGKNASLYVYLGTHAGAAARSAHFVLPVTTYAESEGTFTNHEGRVQRFWAALDAPGMARPAWLVLGALGAELTGGGVPRTAADAFAALAESTPAFDGLDYDTLGTVGAVARTPAGVKGG